MPTERYSTPDGLLTLIVVREDGDISIGFDGYSWHTHGDVLVAEYAMIGHSVGTPDEAVRCLLSDLRSNVARIVLLRKGGEILDVWAVVGEPEEDKYMQPGEMQEIRYWSK